jgi:hypothetical protein
MVAHLTDLTLVTCLYKPFDILVEMNIQHHMVDVMTKVAISADVTGLATAVAGLREGFESPSVVDVHRNARGKCVQRGVHCCRGHSRWGM